MNQPAIEDSNAHAVTSLEQLESLYGEIVPLAITKELSFISNHYRAYIDAAPFVVIATSGPGGLDCSPRGDPAGFVRVVDETTIMLPDRRGNNRLDTLRNIVEDSRIGLLFLIPGINMTMRVNGQARLTTDPDLCASFEMNGKVPATVVVVTVESIYTQCPKALVRSKLWDVDSQVPRSAVPTGGQMAQALTKGEVEATKYDADYPARMAKTIY